MNVSVEMKFYTCAEHGITFGYPRAYDGSDCPLCLQDELKRLKILEIDRRVDASKLYRKMTSLKGVITKLKKARKIG